MVREINALLLPRPNEEKRNDENRKCYIFRTSILTWYKHEYFVFVHAKCSLLGFEFLCCV